MERIAANWVGSSPWVSNSIRTAGGPRAGTVSGDSWLHRLKDGSLRDARCGSLAGPAYAGDSSEVAVSMLMMLARLYVWAVTGVSSSTCGVRTEPTDAQLIDAALSGDAEAFETLLRRNLDAMYAIALRITWHEADADDVVQEASVRIWRALHTFRREARFSTWIYRITTNLAVSHVARRRDASLDPDKHEPASHAADPARRVEDKERLGAALEVFSRLPVDQRSCLVLRESHGLSYEEIAEVSGITIAAVKGRLFRARQSLAEQLAAFEACTQLAEERP